jgi:hypothetical protein
VNVAKLKIRNATTPIDDIVIVSLFLFACRKKLNRAKFEFVITHLPFASVSFSLLGKRTNNHMIALVIAACGIVACNSTPGGASRSMA